MSVLIADEHPLARRGMRVIAGSRLGRTVHEVHVLDEVQEAVLRYRPDLLIMDFMADPSAAAAVIRAVRDGGGPPILVVTSTCSRPVLFQVLNAGASGFLSKSRPPEEYRLAMQRLLKGETFLCPCAEKVLMEHACGAPGPPDVAVFQLDGEERRVLGEIAAGFTSAETASRIGRSERWVEAHRTALRHKLGARSRSELVHLALRCGCLQEEVDDA